MPPLQPTPTGRETTNLAFIHRLGFIAITAGAFAACGALAQSPLDEMAPWPRIHSTNGHTVTLSLPQVETWTSNEFTARAAVGVKPAGAKKESLGAVWFTAKGSVDRATRVVTLDSFDITKARFPGASVRETSNTVAIIQEVMPTGARTVSLDYLINALGFTQAAARQGARGLKHEPPEIIWATNRTVLVLIDGEPVLRPIPDSTLQRVINSPTLIVRDSARFYLAGNNRWFAADTLEGAWSLVQLPPPEVAVLTPASTGATSAAEEIVPRIIVRTHPAELMMTSGMPDFRAIRGTALEYAVDTDRQLFFHTKERDLYLLISGRWFKSNSLRGPWSYVVPSDLPEDFAKIPPGSPQAVVLASVPNTPAAELALLANSVPTTATVRRREAKIELTYDGQPKFQPIAGTQMSYAVNAQLPVIRSGDEFYAVDNGVWFTAKAATGPWEVAADVPEEIYTIPPESPVYYATFASIYDANEDEVEVGYTPGYQGAYEEDGTVVYGTGWDYDCWCEEEYYGWGWTWGYDYIYVPWYQWWVWRDWWDNPGALRQAVIENVYDRWQSRNGVTHHDLAPNAGTRALAGSSASYPALYGRFKGNPRPAPLVPPANTLAVNPYARPKSGMKSGEVPRGAQLLTTVRQSPGGGRDLYASPDGGIYLRKNDGWYRQQAGGHWNLVAPAQGKVSRIEPGASGRTPTAGANGVQRIAPARDVDAERVQMLANRAPDIGQDALDRDIQALEREYYARSLAQIREQNNRSRNLHRTRPSGGRRR